MISQNRFSSSTVCTEHQPSCANGITVGLFIPGSTGAVERSRNRIHALWLESRAAIANLNLEPEAENHLIAACARFVPENLR